MSLQLFSFHSDFHFRFPGAATIAAGLLTLLASTAARSAEAVVRTAHSREDTGFKLDPLLPPASDDAAAQAVFKVIGGVADPNARSGLAVLTDGKVPAGEDDPSGNFFFAREPEQGRLLIDLGRVVKVRSVVTYSWHAGGRAAQNFTLYALGGKEAGFEAELKAEADPEKSGWVKLATADTAAAGPGQHAVEVSFGPDDSLGKYRYLLLETRPNADRSGFGQTFWSEIDVIDADAPEVKRVSVERLVDEFQTEDGKYRFMVDSTQSPDLREWFGKKAMPEVIAWYPKIVEMLAAPGYPSPVSMTLRLREGTIMPGSPNVPAFASGGNIVVSSRFLRSEEKGEAVGCVIHEIVHIAQASEWGRRQRVPSWVVEGVADYIRWFLFEPEAKGAVIRDPDKAKYNASYRVTANFFNWVVTHHVKDLPQKLNATFLTGYNDGLWREWTGKSILELEGDWKESLKREK